VGALLAAMQLLAPAEASAGKAVALFICGTYAAEAFALAAWMWGRGWRRSSRPSPQMWIALTIGADLVAFLTLMGNESAAGLNHGALLVLPVLMAGVLMPRRGALLTAAIVAAALFLETWSSSLRFPAAPSTWLGSALAGMGLWAIAWVAGELSARLRREEQAAVDSQQRAQQQAGLNQLVIQEMSEGVLVIDRYRRVLALNPAARNLLGLDDAWGSVRDTPDSLLQSSSPLLRAVERGHAEGLWPAAGRVVSWPRESEGSAGPAKLRVRLRFTRQESDQHVSGPADPVLDLCVLLLDDARTVQARVQQEKLAAMGRVSAGIAHEIRNPLAAIAQASELLAEDGLGKAQDRLVSIISDNAVRLRRLVDDILESMPTGAGKAGSMKVPDVVMTVVQEWGATVGVARGVVEVDLRVGQALAWFDPEHFRRILVNLLDNAQRHSSNLAGAVRVRVEPGPGDGVMLVVSNDGPPIAPEVEMHLFEPFFSTRSRGSGLGLYLCKELCERHGAQIRHLRLEPPQRHNTAFSVQLPGPSAATSGWGTL
jgi:two-component system sensor histidine kinase PilS (NtrC family)